MPRTFEAGVLMLAASKLFDVLAPAVMEDPAIFPVDALMRDSWPVLSCLRSSITLTSLWSWAMFRRRHSSFRQSR